MEVGTGFRRTAPSYFSMDWFHKRNSGWNINWIFLVLIDDKPVSRSKYPPVLIYIFITRATFLGGVVTFTMMIGSSSEIDTLKDRVSKSFKAHKMTVPHM